MVRNGFNFFGKRRVFYYFWIAALSLFGLAVVSAELVRENFQASSVSSGLSLRGAAALVSDQAGEVLRTAPNAWAEMNVNTSLSPRAGTMTMWVKPRWEVGEGSHPLATLRWQDKRNGYMALTQGWWEPHGAERLYFILNNQDEMHCSTPYQLMPGVWNMVTTVWRGGTEGYCKIFVNGEKIAEHREGFTADYAPAGPLYLGAERGSTDQRNRATKADFADLRIFDEAMIETQVHALFLETAARFKVSTAVPAWLDARSKMNYVPRRDSKGALLESRVIFDEDMHWAYSPAHADAILERVRAAGFNVYIPCIYHGGGSWYPTNLLHPDPKLAARLKEQPDPLAYLIEKAHSMGIEVHPWFTVMYRGDNAKPEFYDSGTPEGAYNAHNPAFRDFIVKLMVDVVKRYDVDGINLDYIRTMGICTSPSCADDYKNKTGGTLSVDMVTRYVFGPARTRLEQWQDAAVRDILARFSSQAREIKPELVISVDGHPRPGIPRALEGRNEIEWANAGLTNVIFSMDYQRDLDVANADQVRRALAVPDRLISIFGNYDKRENGPFVPREGELISAYVEFTQRKWPGSGVAFYIFERVSDEQIRALRAGPFKEPARPYWPAL